MQIARGFLAPPILVFQVQSFGNVKPETTLNYQVGLSGQKMDSAFGLISNRFLNYIESAQNYVENIGVSSTHVTCGARRDDVAWCGCAGGHGPDCPVAGCDAGLSRYGVVVGAGFCL